MAIDFSSMHVQCRVFRVEQSDREKVPVAARPAVSSSRSTLQHGLFSPQGSGENSPWLGVRDHWSLYRLATCSTVMRCPEQRKEEPQSTSPLSSPLSSHFSSQSCYSLHITQTAGQHALYSAQAAFFFCPCKYLLKAFLMLHFNWEKHCLGWTFLTCITVTTSP